MIEGGPSIRDREREYTLRGVVEVAGSDATGTKRKSEGDPGGEDGLSPHRRGRGRAHLGRHHGPLCLADPRDQGKHLSADQ